MQKRLLVTGGSGFVAGSVIEAALERWEVHAISRSDAAVDREHLIWHRCMELDEDGLHHVFHEVDPAAVIHTAAIADIDFSEANQDLAKHVNADLPRVVAELCEDHGIRFVHVSTDNVFDGDRGLYTENDVVNPINFYGRTKVMAEEAVNEVGGKCIVARAALVIGLPIIGSGNSFLSRVMAALDDGKDVTVPGNEIRSPIDVITLGRALVELAGNDLRGCVHLSGSDVLNRYDMMKRVAVRLGHSPKKIVQTDPSGIPGRAPRPLDVSLDNTKARKELDTPMLGLEDALTLVLDTARGK
jgi:dTDP-4-dehydrorhamnose reductase